MKQKTLTSSIKKLMQTYFDNRHLSNNVIVSKHFVERYNERKLQPVDLKPCFKFIADNICKLIYDAEMGIEKDVRIDGIIVKLDYIGNKKFMLKTCYRRTR